MKQTNPIAKIDEAKQIFESQNASYKAMQEELK